MWKPVTADAPPLILASASAIRAQILTQAGLQFAVIPSGIDEAELKARKWDSPEALALALAEAKAAAIDAPAAACVIAADQLLVCDDTLYSKPADLDALRAQLRDLRGRTHALVGGTVLFIDGAPVWTHQSRATLTMRDFSDAFLDDYIAQHGNDALASVGGYRLEGAGIQLFDNIEGDHFAMLGLPLVPLLGALRRARVLTS